MTTGPATAVRSAAAAPSAAALETTPLHVVLRDWPETLVPLRRAGLDPREAGASPLGRLPDGPRLVEVCLEATAWRERGP